MTTIRCLLVALLAATAHAQEEPAAAPEPAPAPAGEEGRSYIRIDGGSAARLPLAVVPCKLLGGVEAEVSADVWSVLNQDLEHSGYFKLVDPAGFLEDATAGIRVGEFSWDNWRTLGAVGLVKAACSRPEPDGPIMVELFVYDIDAGIQMLTDRVTGGAVDQRRLGHQLANKIVEAFTGKPGVFDTRIVAVANYGQGKEIYLFDYDGANPRPVSRNGSINLAPAWSPDGSRISYTSYRDNNPDLWVTDLNTGRHSKVSAHPGINAGAEWSPDGAEVSLTLSKDGDSEIYAIQPDGSIIRRLTRQYGIDVSPTYSPDGSKIAFVSSRNGNPQIFVMDRDGANSRQLTRLGGHNVSPAFSPDGRRILFAGRDEGRFDIFVINVDGTGLRRLTQSKGDDEDPSWSPDGNHVLFSSSRDGRGKQLYIMTADGSAQTRITNGTGSYSNPSWGPGTR
jgi:TolB protein